MSKKRDWQFDISMRAEDFVALKLGKTVTYKLRLSAKKQAVVNVTVQPSFGKPYKEDDQK